jgi:arylsulfatase A-like enzyme
VSEGDERALQPHFRQQICGLVSAVDFNILQVVLALAVRGMLASTLILFHADNGGFIEAGSLNLPFSHQKSSYFEGGVRVPAFIYAASHPSLSALDSASRPHRVINDMFDVTDVLPTLMGYAGLNTSEYELDGYNHWESLSTGAPLQRTFTPLYSSNGAVVHYSGGYIEVIDGVRWKYALNPRAGEFIMAMKRANYTLEGEVLFNLDTDPVEQTNLLEVVSSIPTEREQHLKVVNLLREKSMSVRVNSLQTPSTGTFPPPLRFFPSRLGCWLPLDSPIYNTFKCLDKEPFVPQAWRDAAANEA